jgi:hypothetical protein
MGRSRLPGRRLTGAPLYGETDPLLPVGPFPGGVDELSPDTDLPQGTLRQAVNADFDRAGWFRRRPGRSLFTSGTDCKSVFSDQRFIYWNDGNKLYRSPPHTSQPTLLASLDSHRAISACDVAGVIYFTNGIDRGVIRSGRYEKGWWTPTPSGRLSAFGSGDSVHLVAATLVDSRGRESGATAATKVNGPPVTVSGIPQASGCHARIYMTGAGDPEIFYFVGTTTGASMTIPAEPVGPRLENRFLQDMPAGHIVRYHRGRLYVAKGNILHYSGAMTPGLYDPTEMMLVFEERIRVVQPVTDGIYVVTDRTWWLPDVEVGAMPSREVVYPASAAEGSGLTVPGHFFPETPRGDVAYWFGDHGAVLGHPGGVVHPVQESRLAPERLSHGASLFRREKGISAVLTSGGGGVANGAVATDFVSVEFKRNRFNG